MRSLNSSGVLVFAAAGNEQVNNDELIEAGYPNLPGTVSWECVVAVGATDGNGDRWSEGSADSEMRVKGSNFGARTVDIGAPGAEIKSARATSAHSVGTETR
jgi:subtilisin family serine protease